MLFGKRCAVEVEPMLYNLQIDKEFMYLIPPMQRKEYVQLEINILSDGCRDPIVVWNQTIVDGHNRYQICQRHKIPFTIINMEFDSREEAKAWICSNQLGRRNITVEYRKYLIGMQYDLERCVQKNKEGRNQYSPPRLGIDNNGKIEHVHKNDHVSARTIGEQHHISSGTVQKYARFSRAINKINESAPEVGSKVLDGTYKISHESVVQMAKMEPEQLSEFSSNLAEAKHPVILYNPMYHEVIAKETRKGNDTICKNPTVKDMPEYDPDAEVAGLTLTVPSWIKVIEHTKDNTRIHDISENAKAKVKSALHDLVDAASMYLRIIEGE